MPFQKMSIFHANDLKKMYTIREEGHIMDQFLLFNLLAFIAITLYALYLFIKAVGTRLAYIRMGKKTQFDLALKERLKNVGTIVFGQTKLFKDKKSGTIHLLLFYGFILVQFGAIDMFIKGLAPGNHLPFGPLYPAFTFFQEIVTVTIDGLQLKTKTNTVKVKYSSKTKFELDKKTVDKSAVKKGDRAGVIGSKVPTGEVVANEIILGLPAPKTATEAKAEVDVKKPSDHKH